MTNFRDSPVAQFLKKLSAGTVFYTVAAITIPLNSPPPGYQANFKAYLDENLERIIAQQEETIDIKYPEERPLIHYQLPTDKVAAFGFYDPKTNEIFLLKDQLDPPLWDFATAKDTINHELFHYWMDKYGEQTLDTSWPTYGKNANRAEVLCTKLISEGAATYVERKMNHQEDDTFKDEDWPKSIGGFFTYYMQLYPNFEIIQSLNYEVIYEGGYHLVKPIFDRYGAEAIKYLMSNPPTEEELFKLPSYQKKILEEISAQQRK